MLKNFAALAAMTIAVPPAWAGDDIPPATGGRTYVQHQILQQKARHPGIESITIFGVRDAAEGPVILGSTADQASVFRKVDGAVPTEGQRMSADKRQTIVDLPFSSRTNRPIGIIEIRFRNRPNTVSAYYPAIARSVQAGLSRATYSAKNAIDPYPFDPSVSSDTYAQALTERTTARHPEIVVMMIHAAAPSSAHNIVIGSNVGRLGKPADEDDLKVAEQGTENIGLNSDGDQYETEVPLLDAKGRRIGALGLVFAYRAGDDKDALRARGVKIRDELAPMIDNRGQLFSRQR